MWYNILVVKGEHPPTATKKIKKFLKNFQKTLDKSFKIWYNKYTKVRETQSQPKKKIKKFLKKLRKTLDKQSQM